MEFASAWPEPERPMFQPDNRKKIEYEEEEYNLMKRRITGWYMCLLAFLLPILVGMIVLTAYVLYPRTNGVNALKVDTFNLTCPDATWVMDKTVGAIGKCYKFQTTPQPIAESKTDCESLDQSSHLVAIKSAAEQASIEAIHATLTAGNILDDITTDIDNEIQITKSDELEDGGSAFQGYASTVSSKRGVRQVLDKLLQYPGVVSASHLSYAYVYDDPLEGSVANFVSDGDHGIGLELLKTMNQHHLANKIWLVTRKCGHNFEHIGKRRFLNAINVCSEADSTQ